MLLACWIKLLNCTALRDLLLFVNKRHQLGLVRIQIVPSCLLHSPLPVASSPLEASRHLWATLALHPSCSSNFAGVLLAYVAHPFCCICQRRGALLCDVAGPACSTPGVTTRVLGQSGTPPPCRPAGAHLSTLFLGEALLGSCGVATAARCCEPGPAPISRSPGPGTCRRPSLLSATSQAASLWTSLPARDSRAARAA